MQIATPHLGVRDYTFLDEVGIKIPYFTKALISHTMYRSGNELFLLPPEKSSDVTDTLLYKMATTGGFLEPLRQFKARRLYANLRNDFVVPLGTAAFIAADTVEGLRKKHQHTKGIVEVLHSSGNSQEDSQKETCSDKNTCSYVADMIRGLDSLQWEKMIVGFDLSYGLLPLAHNKICSLAPGPRHPSFVTDYLFRFNEGKHVMENASIWLTSD
jgi:hypothetical protein